MHDIKYGNLFIVGWWRVCESQRGHVVEVRKLTTNLQHADAPSEWWWLTWSNHNQDDDYY